MHRTSFASALAVAFATHQPGEEILCIDGDPVGGGNMGRDRESLRAAMLEETDAFLAKAAILDAPRHTR